MKTSDLRQGEVIVRAVLARLHLVDTEEARVFVAEGTALIEKEAAMREWPRIAEWTKRACAYLFALSTAAAAARGGEA